MAKPTIETVCVKLDNIHEDIKEMKTDVKKNTEFRNRAHGAIAGFGFVFGVIGGGFVWLLNKLFGK